MGLLGGQSGPRVGSGPVGSIPTPVNAAICQQRGGFHGVERGYSAGDSGVLTSLGDNERTMNFYSAYQHGFVRVAACTHHTTIGDPAANAASVLDMARACHDDGAALAVFPELTLSGYSIEDVLLQDSLLDAVEDALLDLVTESADLLPVLVVGAPLRHRHRIYNTAVVIHRGAVLGVVPKSYLPTYREFYERRQLTYLGYSYGTRIGSAYAEEFPQRVRAMILDGAVDPNADPIEAELRQAKGFQDAFNNYAADCAKNAGCPLGADPAKAVEVYHSLVDPLVDPDNPRISRPARTKDPRGLSYSDAIVGTIMALYSPNLWQHLTDGLSELVDNRGDTLLALADMYMRRDSHGRYNNSGDARVAINCVDQPPVTDRDKVIDEDRRAREIAPFMSYGKFTGDAPLGTCAFWPVPPTSQPHAVSAPGLVPTVVVSTTHDPATPYKAGVDLANQLRGSLLTFDGTQHTVVFQGDSCIDEYVTAYLIGGTTPPSGAKC